MAWSARRRRPFDTGSPSWPLHSQVHETPSPNYLSGGAPAPGAGSGRGLDAGRFFDRLSSLISADQISEDERRLAVRHSDGERADILSRISRGSLLHFKRSGLL